MPTSQSSWFVTPKNLKDPKFILFCLPFAGGGASAFHPWAADFSAQEIQLSIVQYPGRENRLSEPCIKDINAMVERLCEEISSFAANVPFGFYGHSMGALLAWETANALAEKGLQEVEALFLSGKNPPHKARNISDIHTLPKDEFIQELKKFGNLSDEIVQIPELMDLVIPIIRADMEMLYNYKQGNKTVLDNPIHIYGGLDDPWTTEESLNEWKDYSRTGFQLKMFPGDHFFIKDNKEALLSDMIKSIQNRAQNISM